MASSFLVIGCKKSKSSNIQLSNQAIEISKVENIKYRWNTLDFEFTSDYDKVIHTNRQIIDKPYIYDFYTKANKKVLKLKVTGEKSFVFDLEIPNGVSMDIISHNLGDDYILNCILIVSIEKIHKIPFIINSYYEEEDGEIYPYIELEENYNFKGSGKLIKITPIKK